MLIAEGTQLVNVDLEWSVPTLAKSGAAAGRKSTGLKVLQSADLKRVPWLVHGFTTRPGGFTTSYIRGSYDWTKNFHLVAGIDNLFNRSYQEHLDLRLLGPTGFPAPPTRVLSPGITPYFGLDWDF